MRTYSDPYGFPHLRSYPRPHWSPYRTFADILQASLQPNSNVILRNVLVLEIKAHAKIQREKRNNQRHEWAKIAKRIDLPIDVTNHITTFTLLPSHSPLFPSPLHSDTSSLS